MNKWGWCVLSHFGGGHGADETGVLLNRFTGSETVPCCRACVVTTIINVVILFESVDERKQGCPKLAMLRESLESAKSDERGRWSVFRQL